MGPAQGLRHRCSQHLEAMYLQATECTPAPPTCGLAAAALRPRAGCRAHISAWAAATWGWTAGAGPVGWRVQADAGDGDGRLYTKLRPVSRALLPGRNMAGEGGVAWSLWGLNEVWCGACMAYARVCVCAFARAPPPLRINNWGPLLSTQFFASAQARELLRVQAPTNTVELQRFSILHQLVPAARKAHTCTCLVPLPLPAHSFNFNQA